MSQDPTTSKFDQVGPYLSLKVGDLIAFELFPDVPPETVRLRKGVIVSAPEVQIADLTSGDITVQTLLALASLDAFESGKREPEELVPLEAIKSMKIDRSYRTIANWQEVIPALGGGTPRQGSPLSLQRVEEDGESSPASLKDLFRPARSKKAKRSGRDLKEPGPAPYLSPTRR